jgi:hypothetical protein
MNMQLSKYFTLEDLTTTSQNADNTPDAMSLGNLQNLAVLLDQIYDTIGPFHVTSGYRSPAVNELIHGATNSYHTRGLAADLRPYNNTPYNFFVKLLQSPIFSSLGELINEADEEGIVHVSLQTPEKQSVAMYLQNGSYYRYSPQAIANLQSGQDTSSNNEQSSDQVIESNVSDSDTNVNATTYLVLAAAAFFAVAVVIQSRRTET